MLFLAPAESQPRRACRRTWFALPRFLFTGFLISQPPAFVRFDFVELIDRSTVPAPFFVRFVYLIHTLVGWYIPGNACDAWSSFSTGRYKVIWPTLC